MYVWEFNKTKVLGENLTCLTSFLRVVLFYAVITGLCVFPKGQNEYLNLNKDRSKKIKKIKIKMNHNNEEREIESPRKTTMQGASWRILNKCARH